MSETTFKPGDRVTKTKGSNWTGRVVGTYSTALTPEGYAVESETEKGSVQIYPAAALAPAPALPESGVDEMRSALEWYADTMCEHSIHFEGCGKLSSDECGGCRARAALATPAPAPAPAPAPVDAGGLVAELRDVLTDWNGADIPDAELPRIDVLCGTLRRAVSALAAAAEREAALEEKVRQSALDYLALDMQATEALERATAAEAERNRMQGLVCEIAPYIDSIVCYASTVGEHEPNRIAHEVRAVANGPSQDELVGQQIAARMIAKIDAATAKPGVGRAWLIELKGATPSWAIVNPNDYDEHWTTDSARALRFARKADAEAYIAHIGWTEAFASEHIWDDGRRSSAPAPETWRDLDDARLQRAIDAFYEPCEGTTIDGVRSAILAWERERCAQIVDEWSKPQTMKLHAGEMTAGEVRTSKAILKGIAAAIRKETT